jgi:hypothetical protein
MYNVLTEEGLERYLKSKGELTLKSYYRDDEVVYSSSFDSEEYDLCSLVRAGSKFESLLGHLETILSTKFKVKI